MIYHKFFNWEDYQVHTVTREGVQELSEAGNDGILVPACSGTRPARQDHGIHALHPHRRLGRYLLFQLITLTAPTATGARLKSDIAQFKEDGESR